MDEQITVLVDALVALAKVLPGVATVSVHLNRKNGLGNAVYFHARREEDAAALCTRFGIETTSVFNGSLYAHGSVGAVAVTILGPGPSSAAPKPIDSMKLLSATEKADLALAATNATQGDSQQ